MKPGARIIAIDDSPLAGKKTLCTGVVARAASRAEGLGVEGIVSFHAERDGSDSAEKLVKAVAKSRFAKQIRAVIVHSVTLAGLNVLDARKVAEELGAPVICVTKKRPGERDLQEALLKKAGGARKTRLVEAAGPVHHAEGVFFHCIGIRAHDAALVLRKLGGYPWPLRLAHLIGAAVVLGESKGG
ncbi:MAG: DUF99 family protein [Candidatus Micrarchaeota archaeon]|nr:DUF99 family protein [Candidatus Micrarchaeota archaeon]